MNETVPLLQHLEHIIADPHFWMLIGAYWLFSAFVGGMPAPEAGDSKTYRWAFQSLNILASNVSRAFSDKIPGLKEAKDETPKGN